MNHHLKFVNKLIYLSIIYFCLWVGSIELNALAPENFSNLKRDQIIADFRVTNLYSDGDQKVVGAKFLHVPTGAPVFLLQIESVPQVFTWIDTPAESNKGLAHSLEHLVAGKGTKGRYFELLRDMRFGQSTAATYRDYNFYGLSSGTGTNSFFEQFHAWLDALYYPDFTDTEAEREFYHFGVTKDARTKARVLVEQGSVYDEMQSGQGSYTYVFELNKRVLGEQNPFGFDIGGVPDEMREVTPTEIRRFHDKYYRLGPTTGFIFSIDPRENVVNFLQRVSGELRRLPKANLAPQPNKAIASGAKYPIQFSENVETKLYRFPGANETDPGEIRFSWKPVKTQSALELKLLQLFFRALAEGERSLLYKSLVDSKTRELDTGATTVESEPFLGNSFEFPFWNVGVSGVPGNRISLEKIEQIKSLLMGQIAKVFEYPDHSEHLTQFNDLVQSYAQAWQRSEGVWVKSPPGFSSGANRTDWKEHLEYLEMDPSFVRSISEDPVWRSVDEQLRSGTNIWHDLIQRFRLQDSPYAAGSVPSLQLLEQLEQQKADRIKKAIDILIKRYRASTSQQALALFEMKELSKTKELDRIAERVRRPRFVDHPPLTPDDGIHYAEFDLRGVPVIAAIFDRPPTVDIGLSFDLKGIPRRYYKYLPILPRCLDSVGVKQGNSVVSYSDFLGLIHKATYGFTIGYEFNILSKRMDLTIRASAVDISELRVALNLISQMMQSNNLDMSNADRLRDITAQRLSNDESYTKKDESEWVLNPAYSFRNQEDALFLALGSQFTRAHWDGRLKWLLHQPISAERITRLVSFATGVLSSGSIVSQQQFLQKLDQLDAQGLEAELIEYWKRNLSFYPENEIASGLRQLTLEVEEDLRTGPAKAIAELVDLQKIILNQHSLHVDLTLSQSALDGFRPELGNFLSSIPDHSFAREEMPDASGHTGEPIMAKLERRYGLSDVQFPWYVGLINPDSVTGNAVFYSYFPGYDQLTHKSLVQAVASKLFSGDGPHSFYKKAREAGLVYGNLLTSDPGFKLIWYYADRSPDIPSLIQLVDSIVAKASDLHDPFLVDYALRQAFPFPRTALAFSERGKAIAWDIRDGHSPETIRRFSESLLQLRRTPDLLTELTHAVSDSICGILVEKRCEDQQKASHSIFFFVGSEKILSDVERRLPIPRLLRIWPSDYWVD